MQTTNYKTLIIIVGITISSIWFFGARNESGEVLYTPKDCDDDINKIYYDLGVLSQQRGDYGRAIEQYSEALTSKPYDIPAIDNLGFCYDRIGDKDDALKTYFRKLFYTVTPSAFQSDLSSVQTWAGQDVAGKTIYVFNDLPDKECLLISRFLCELKRRGGHVIFKSPQTLHNLFDKGLGTIKTIQHEAELVDLTIDFVVNLGKVPYLLDMSYETIPGQQGYLTLPKKNLPKKIAPLFSQRNLNVGIAWRSGDNETAQQKSFIQLKELMAAFPHKNIACFLLQTPDERVATNQWNSLVPYIKNLDDLANIITHLDLIISVDNVIAHIAGALGKQVLLLLNSKSDWNWFNHSEGQQTVWYQSIKKFTSSEETKIYDVLAYLRDEVVQQSSSLLAMR